ncbi:MAG: EamA family transporter [Eubacterium sp.]|nr:EamA family transporter [Eubacterium sp.]
MIKYYIVALLSGLLSSVQQILLKKSSMDEHGSVVREYINIRVIAGYGINLLCVLLMVYAYIGMPYRYGVILESLAYIYVMILSRLFFGERITKKRVIGNLLILAGAIVFVL